MNEASFEEWLEKKREIFAPGYAWMEDLDHVKDTIDDLKFDGRELIAALEEARRETELLEDDLLRAKDHLWYADREAYERAYPRIHPTS